MSFKRKRIIDIISFRKENDLNIKKESDELSLVQTKNYRPKTNHFIPFVKYLTVPLLTLNKEIPKELSNIEETLNSNEFIFFHRLSPDSYQNKIYSSNELEIFQDFHKLHLYTFQLICILIIYILNKIYETNIINLFDFFDKLVLYNLFFLLIINDKIITASNKKKMRDDKRGEYLLYWQKKWAERNYLNCCENALFEPKNVIKNTCKLIDEINNKNDDIIITKKRRKERNKFLIRNINHLRNFIDISKYIILLNLFNNIFVNNKSYKMTLKIKGIGNKTIFYSKFPSESRPKIVNINGNKQNHVTHSYILNKTANIIELVWDKLITSCDNMFRDCSDIIEIDLSNFKTTNVDNMRTMFYGCSSLTSLNLSNFVTSKVTLMNYMFYGCSSLTSLNLSNFDTSNVKSINNMFDGCENLEYINMINFNGKSLPSESEKYSNMLNKVPDNIVVCIKKSIIQKKIYDQISSKTCHIEYCKDDWKLKQKKLIQGNNQCADKCPKTYPYEYNGKCISKCPNGNFYDNNIAKCKCELEKCLTCPKVALNKKLCTKCNDNYYPKENDPLNLGEYFNCYNETPEGYYLDTINSLYKKITYICVDQTKKNCYKIIEYSKSKITFNIKEINSNAIGSCLYFNKSIYYGQINCIDKPKNTYYVINGIENTGIIKDCNISCKSCYGESTKGNTNCIECADNYFKTEYSNTNCMHKDLIPSNYYLNITDNIYYQCHLKCKTCIGSYNIITNDMHCIFCVDNTFFLYGDNKSNCYYKEELFESEKYYLSNIDNKFHKCYHTCSSCDNYEPKETKHYCINCNIGYYFLENTANCFNNKTIIKNYYLDKSFKPFTWRKCNKNCTECNLFTTLDGDCVLTCPNSTYINILNNICIENCPDDSIIYKDMCIPKIKEKEILLSDFKNKILSNINSYTDSIQVINGSTFIGLALSSNNMDLDEQLKNGISAIDLGNCTEIIKEYYNISKNESLMVFNIETKNTINNNEKSFNLGKDSQIEIYDMSGRELDLSICKEDIKVIKYIGDIKELDFQSAKSYSKQGIDVFNAGDPFFSDICHPYDDPDGRDITLIDRRADIYQNATFCQNGCSYFGMNYNLTVANCKCDSRLLQGKLKNITKNNELNSFKELSKSFISNLIDFNFEILGCYNLALNTKILIHNIGFFSLFGMLFLQFLFFIFYLIKKIEPIKNFILNYNEKFKINQITKDNNNINLASPIKKLKLRKDLLQMKYKKHIKKLNNIQIRTIIKKKPEEIEPKDQSNSNRRLMNEKGIYLNNILQNNNSVENNSNNKNIMNNINNYYSFELKNLTKGISRILNNDEDLQNLDYEEAIIYDKRNYIRMFWSFLVDSQIILETFFTENYLYLFVIKLSFFVFTFQISFFLNALFYTDNYVSDAYHNNGVLEFIVGLPKSIYSFIGTLITTSLLKMLSNSKSELTKIINNRRKDKNYLDIINKELSKLSKKLIAYFIIVFLLNMFFSYYVTVFCAVYRYSQKYWFYGCLESFAMDSLISLICCIFVSFLRFISIRKQIKYCYAFANIINTFI